MNGWWIFAGTAAVALLSKHLIRFRGPPLPESLELRPRPLLRPARIDARRSARALVGADVAVDGARARDHRRRRLHHPPAAPPARDRGHVLDHVRARHRRDRRRRPRDDGPLAPRPDHRLRVLAGARLLARGAHLPLLHDHRPEDVADRTPSATCLRDRDRAPRGAPDRADDNRVLDEGRAPRRADARLRIAPGDCVSRAAVRPDLHRSAASHPRRAGGRRGASPSRACSCSPASRPGRAPRSQAPPAPGRKRSHPQRSSPRRGSRRSWMPLSARQITADLVTDLRLEAQALRKRDKNVAAAAAGRRAAPGALAADRPREQSRADRPRSTRREPRAQPRGRREPGAAARDCHRLGHRAAAHGRRDTSDGRLPRQRDAVHANARAPARPGPVRDHGDARRHARRRLPPARLHSSPPRASEVSSSRTSRRRSGSTSARARFGRRARRTRSR